MNKLILILLALILLSGKFVFCENADMTFVSAFNTSDGQIIQTDKYYINIGKYLPDITFVTYVNRENFSKETKFVIGQYAIPLKKYGEYLIINDVGGYQVISQILRVNENNQILFVRNIDGGVSSCAINDDNILIKTVTGGVYIISYENNNVTVLKLEGANVRSHFHNNGDYTLEYNSNITKLYNREKKIFETKQHLNMVSLSKKGTFIGTDLNNNDKIENYYYDGNGILTKFDEFEPEGSIIKISDSGDMYAYGNTKKINIKNIKTGIVKEEQSGDYQIDGIEFDNAGGYYILKSNKNNDLNDSKVIIQKGEKNIIIKDYFNISPYGKQIYFNNDSIDLFLRGGVICRIANKEFENGK